jgi:hypothetical protein
MLRSFAVALCWLACLGPLAAQPICRAPYLDARPAREAPPTATYTGWAESMHYAGWWYFWFNGAPRCAYWPDRNEFSTFDAQAQRWSSPRPWPYPIDPPGHRKPAARPAVNFGIDEDQLRGAPPSGCAPDYSINGQPVSRDQALAAAAGGLPNDSVQPWLVVVSRDKAQRERIVNDLANHPSLAELRSKVRLQVYDDPDHWHLAGYKLRQDARFQKSGVGVFLVDPPIPGSAHGEAREARYSYDGPEALRRIDPAFDPNRIPDSAAPAWQGILKALGLDLGANPLPLLLIGGGLLLAVLVLIRKPAAAAPPIRADPSWGESPAPRRPPRGGSGTAPPNPAAPAAAATSRGRELTLGDLALAELDRLKEEEAAELARKKAAAARQDALRELLGGKAP